MLDGFVRRFPHAIALLVLALSVAYAPAHAERGSNVEKRVFDVPAGEARTSIPEFARQAGYKAINMLPVEAHLVTTRKGRFVSLILHAQVISVDADQTEEFARMAVQRLPD
jgi:hypothetical protein